MDETNETFECDYCHGEFSEEDMHSFDGQCLCIDCYENETMVCAECGDRIWRESNYGDNETPLCENCYEDNYTHCDDCGHLLRFSDAYYDSDDEDNEYPLCENCFPRHQNKSIHNYSYKPEPIFYGGGNRFYGVELEIDEGGKLSGKADKLLQIGNADTENIYIKTDGSLDYGLEIVTHPMSLDYHKNKMPWQKIMRCALDMGYYSHQTDTCGLHVHVNRNTFSDDRVIQEEYISRILFFVERFWEELLKFSRRTQTQMNRWAARYGYKNKPGEIMEHAKEGHCGRYTCVNITNYSTIEFRIFRGTLKWNTLIATLQLVNEICNVASCFSDEEITAFSWPDFVATLDGEKSPELITYLKERRLYVNEPVNCEEDY